MLYQLKLFFPKPICLNQGTFKKKIFFQEYNIKILEFWHFLVTIPRTLDGLDQLFSPKGEKFFTADT